MFIIIIAAAALLVAWFIILYNKFIKNKNLIREAWSGIDVQLKRRYDLIPNLVETVKGYSTHEKELFKNITDLRTRSMNTSSPGRKGKI